MKSSFSAFWHPRVRTWTCRTALALLAAMLVGFQQAPPEPADELEQVAARILQECKKDSKCVAHRLHDLVWQKNPAHALEVLDRMVEKDPQVRRISHNLAHEVGYATHDRYPTLAEKLSHCRDNAAGGCFHGVMMQFIGHHESTRSKEVTGACTLLQSTQPQVYKDCLHGLGHGMMMFHFMATAAEPGLPELQHALEDCGLLAGEYEQYHCSRGVFMEYLVAATTPIFHYAAAPRYKAGDLHWPCNVVDPRHIPACYDYQGHHILMNVPTLKAAFQVCAQAPGTGNAHCASNMGRTLNPTVHPDRPQDLVALCNEAVDPTQRGHCVLGAANHHVYSSRNVERAVLLCKAAITPQDRGKGCIDGVRAEAASYFLPDASVVEVIRKAGLEGLL